MKKTIFALAVLCILLLAGCTTQANEPSAEEEYAEEADAEELLDAFAYKLDKLNVLIEPAFDYEANVESRVLVKNSLKKISQFQDGIQELKQLLEAIEKEEFDEKERLVGIFSELVELMEDLAEEYDELYSFHLDLLEQEALEQKKGRADELVDALYNCRCRDVDCETLYKSSIEAIEESVEIFEKIRDEYRLESFDAVVKTWQGQKDVMEEHVPDLIEKSKRYHDRCWKINDAYNKFVGDLERIEETTETEMMDEISEKWIVPLSNIVEDLGNIEVELEMGG